MGARIRRVQGAGLLLSKQYDVTNTSNGLFGVDWITTQTNFSRQVDDVEILWIWIVVKGYLGDFADVAFNYHRNDFLDEEGQE